MASLLDLLLGYRSPLDLLPEKPQGVRVGADGGMSLADILRNAEIREGWHQLQPHRPSDDPATIDDVRSSMWDIVEAAGMGATRAPGISPSRPGQRKAPASRKYFRGTQRDSPSNEVGHMMFTERKDDAKTYGKNLWEFTGSPGDPGVVSSSSPEVRLGVLRALRSERDKLDGTARDKVAPLVRDMSPARIVDSAGMWDSPEAVAIAYERFFHPKGIKAVITPDGAIVFDKTMVKKAKD